MRRTHKELTDLANSMFELYNQKVRVVDWAAKVIILSNGMSLVGNDRLYFYRRITHKTNDIWIKNMDSVLDGTANLDEIKFDGRSKGGKAVWEKSGHIIRKKLKGRIPHNKGIKGKYKHGPRTAETKAKISKKNSGKNNGMYGTKMSDEDKQKASEKMKDLILTGKFTPNSNNRNTHWDSTLNGKKYRSSWEALYQYINPVAEYETLRIPYQYNNKTSIYIIDFVDHINKLVVEVKPKELCTGDKFESKMIALSAWAFENDYSVLIVDAQWLQMQTTEIDYLQFDDKTKIKIQKLYEINKTNRN